jgi:PAS domain S-box-containing protein
MADDETQRDEPTLTAVTTRPRVVAIYIAGALIASVGAALLAPVVPPTALAVVLFATLSCAGLLAYTAHRNASAAQPNNQLRRELVQTRRDYERLFTSVPCYICVQDREHHIIEANELYRREFGATDRSLCYEVCKRRKTKCPKCVVDMTFADGKIHSSEENLITRNGDRISAIVHTRPVLDDDGEIRGVMEVFTDITETKRMQRQLALMGRAVASMAHRVKNILMGLDGGIFIVNEGLETSDRAAVTEGWEMVERNVQLVSRIVKDLLFCAKDRTPDFQEDVCPHDIVLAVRDLFSDRMADESIDLEIELGQPARKGVFDPDGLHNMLCNLVANAIDACRFDPDEDKLRHTVTLRCHQNGEGATTFQVADDGAGIPEDLNNKVFETFFSSKGTEGTGIGLLVVQKVAEEHGGKVTFTSRPGKGTTFTVTIPTASDTPALQLEHPPLADPHPSGSLSADGPRSR